MKTTASVLFLGLLSFWACSHADTDDPYKGYITYEQYGARGDGKTNDQDAIIAAHNAANRTGMPVKAVDGKTYYIGGGSKYAVIKTDVDWGTAGFIINDLAADNYSNPVFSVEASEKPYSVTIPGPVAKGQTNLGISLKQLSLVHILNSGKPVYIRQGPNQNNGTSQQEVLLVHKDGSIDPSTAPVWDYDRLTKVTVYPVEEKRLTIKGGTFTTIANRNESKYSYVKRGIIIRRSNVLVENLTHLIKGEVDHGAPYSYFLGTDHVYDVEVRDCVFSGHRTYKTIGAAGTSVSMGSYDFNSSHSIGVALRGCSQSNSLNDDTFWGVYTSNFSKNLLVEDSALSRFDAHQGVSNVTLRGCEFGHQGVRMVGFGKLLMENCTCNVRYLVYLRPDYGSSWDGDIEIRGCVMNPYIRSFDACYVLMGENAHTHDFGYDCKLPGSITVDGLVIRDGGYTNKNYRGPFAFSDFKVDAPVSITIRGVTTESGKTLQVCPNPGLFN